MDGVGVEYEKTEKLPEVPDVIRFLHDKVSKKYLPLTDDMKLEELKMPFVVVAC